MKTPLRLRQTVTNPTPDRRHVQTVWAMEEWKEGSIWVLTTGNGEGRLELRGAHGRIEAIDNRFPSLREAMEPIKLLEFGDGHTDEARDSFRAFMAMSESSARSVLASLYFVGTASMEDLRTADKDVLDLDEEVYESFYT